MSLPRRSTRPLVAGWLLALAACGAAQARRSRRRRRRILRRRSPAPGGARRRPAAAARLPDCSRPLSLGLHEHGLLYTGQTGEGIDKDIADEMVRRSGCHLTLTVLPRARIWQLIESGALDFTLSGITNPQREKFAAFAWYVSNKYYLLVRRDADVRSVAEFRRKHGLRVGLIRSFRYGDQANLFVDALEAEDRITYAGSLDPLYTILLDDGIQAMIIEPFDFPVIAGAQLKAQTGDPRVRRSAGAARAGDVAQVAVAGAAGGVARGGPRRCAPTARCGASSRSTSPPTWPSR